METVYKSRTHSDKKRTITPQKWAEARDRKITENITVTNTQKHLSGQTHTQTHNPSLTEVSTLRPEERIKQRSYIYIFFFFVLCMPVYYECPVPKGGQERASDLLGLAVLIVVGNLWVLRLEPRPFGRVASAFKC